MIWLLCAILYLALTGITLMSMVGAAKITAVQHDEDEVCAIVTAGDEHPGLQDDREKIGTLYTRKDITMIKVVTIASCLLALSAITAQSQSNPKAPQLWQAVQICRHSLGADAPSKANCQAVEALWKERGGDQQEKDQQEKILQHQRDFVRDALAGNLGPKP